MRYTSVMLIAAMLLGMVGDYFFFERQIGISAPLFVAVGLLVLAWLSRAEERPSTLANRWIGAAALFFAACLAWRSAPFLNLLNFAAVMALLALRVITYRNPALFQQSLPSLLIDSASAVVDAGFRPFRVLGDQVRSVQWQAPRRVAFGPILRGLALATPMLMIFTGLLMAADQVFASYVSQVFSFELPFDLADLIKHGLIIGGFAWLIIGGLTVALDSGNPGIFGRLAGDFTRWVVGLVSRPEGDLPAEGDTQRLQQRPVIDIGAVEATTVLIAVDLLFGAFMLIQGAYLFGGLDTLARSGMTYAEYARRGFFELVAAVFLALAMLCGLAVISQRRTASERWRFNVASVVMVGLLFGMLLSAFLRMRLYEQAFGYTELRLYVYSAIFWLGLVLLVYLLALFRHRAHIFSFGVIVVTVIWAGALNVSNPHAMIVQENVRRYQAGGELDVEYLTTLSPDAALALSQALPLVDANAADTLGLALHTQAKALVQEFDANGWPSWHMGKMQAIQVAR